MANIDLKDGRIDALRRWAIDRVPIHCPDLSIWNAALLTVKGTLLYK